MYRPLLSRDERGNRWVPELAVSWTRVDDTTYDFQLREDVTFHSGNPFTADDVVYTGNYVIDPKTRIPGKARFSFLKSVEKLGPYTVRFTTNGVIGTTLESIAYDIYILDAKEHVKHAEAGSYGRLSASSAGHYRLVSMDPTKGALLERFENFKGDPAYHRAPIKQIEIIPLPDRQTQVAKMMIGEVDLLRNIEPDAVDFLGKQPGIQVSYITSGGYIYLLLDAAGRSNIPAMKDLRVRRAIAMAIDRKSLAETMVAGASREALPEALCFKTTVACAWSTKLPEFNLAEAKRLLAEAGYPNGLNLPFQIHTPYRQIAEAIAHQLARAGIKTNQELLNITAYTRRRGEGGFTMFLGMRPTATYAEATAVMVSLFGSTRDYSGDPDLAKSLAGAERTFDISARTKIIQAAIDRNNEQLYILPVSTFPSVLVHKSEVAVRQNILSYHDVDITDYYWK